MKLGQIVGTYINGCDCAALVTQVDSRSGLITLAVFPPFIGQPLTMAGVRVYAKRPANPVAFMDAWIL